jgi:hypothetical protein
MRKSSIVAALLALGASVACGETSVAPPRDGANDSPEKKYQVSATVLESREHGPELCLGVVMESLPPQCGGPSIVGWDWGKVGGEETAAGTTWGTYHVIGTFDGTTFTLTEPPSPPKPGKSSEAIGPACPEPAGGWHRPQPERTTSDDFDAAVRSAQAEKDFAGLWLFDPNPPTGEEAQDIPNVVLNATFTGDLERHETELRALWGGALCLTKRAHTLAELEKIKDELTGDAGGLGLMVLTADADDVRNVVRVEVVWFEPEDQAALDARYGTGVVVLRSVLQPAP